MIVTVLISTCRPTFIPDPESCGELAPLKRSEFVSFLINGIRLTSTYYTVANQPKPLISMTTQSKETPGNGPDPILLTLFANRFMSVAEAMGRSLQQTSISTNIKERLDFSCALFAPDGDLVANAPFIPIHLGSMSL